MSLGRLGIPLKPWAKACKKALIDKDMSINDLAKATGYSRQHVSAVINCRTIYYTCQEVICKTLGVEY